MTRRRIALFVLTAYIATGVLLEVTHHDDIALGSGSRPTVAEHDCSARETHVPLDSLHPCMACFQSSQRIATPAQSFVPDFEAFLCLSVVLSPDEQFFSTDYLFTGKRGPPLS